MVAGGLVLASPLFLFDLALFLLTVSDDSTKDLYFLDSLNLEDPEVEAQGVWFYAQEQNQAAYKLALDHLIARLSQTLTVVRTINGQVGDVVLSPDSINAAYASHGHSISDIIELSETLSGVGSDLSDLESLVSGLQYQADSLLGQLNQAGSDIASISGSLDFLAGTTQHLIAGLQSDIDIHSAILSSHDTRLDTLATEVYASSDSQMLSSISVDSLGTELPNESRLWLKPTADTSVTLQAATEDYQQLELSNFSQYGLAVFSGTNDTISDHLGSLSGSVFVSAGQTARFVADTMTEPSQWGVVIF